MKSFYDIVKLRISTLRKERKMTQTKLSSLTGVDRGIVGKYDRNQVQNFNAGTLGKLAYVLGVSVPHLFEDIDPSILDEPEQQDIDPNE